MASERVLNELAKIDVDLILVIWLFHQFLFCFLFSLWWCIHSWSYYCARLHVMVNHNTNQVVVAEYTHLFCGWMWRRFRVKIGRQVCRRRWICCMLNCESILFFRTKFWCQSCNLVFFVSKTSPLKLVCWVTPKE